MDLASIASKATPGLLDEIANRFPSSPQQWVDDRTRTLATIALLEMHKPDLLTVHLVDLDSEEHDTQPFSAASKAILEYTDELLGRVVAALPPGATLAVVSDHGFAPVNRTIHLKAALGGDAGELELNAGTVCAIDDKAAASLAQAWRNADLGIGRAIPPAEWKRFLPEHAGCAAAYEPADGVMFGSREAGPVMEPRHGGEHGLWPGRPNYRSVFLLWKPGMKAKRLPEMSMLEIAPRLAEVIGVRFTPARE